MLSAVYRPIAVLVVRFRIVVVAAASVLMIATVPTFQRLGSEFMPPLDEGSLLVMPTTFPGIAIEEARRALTAAEPHHHAVSLRSPRCTEEAGRAETATDPAQLDMIESVIALRPRAEWPRDIHPAGTARRPDWARSAACDACGPSSRRARSRSCRVIWMPRSGCPATRWPSRRRSARASTC